MEVIWSRLAQNTLIEILQYIEERFNSTTAQKVADSIIEYTYLLESFPRMGVIDNRLSTAEIEVRSINCKRNVIYYILNEHTIIIAAIFDTRRNPEIIKRIIHYFCNHSI